MGESSYSGFMNVSADDKLLYSVSIDTAKEMIQAMRRGREAEAGAQSAFYGSRGPTSGTIDELKESIKKEINKLHNNMKRKNLKEQVSKAAQRTYEMGLKRLQKGVLRFQLRWIEKQRAAAQSSAATAASQASKGFDEQIKALEDQIKAIDNPPKQKGGKGQQNENLLENYINSRKNTNLMTHMDLYKQTVLLEGTMKKFFKMFEKGKTNEEVLRHYAKEGIAIPEQFLTKIRKQYENLKKQKLEIDFSEQESKDFFNVPIRGTEPILFDLGDEDEKTLSSRLYKEAKIIKNYPIPPEIEDALINDLKMNPLIRFVKNLKAVNSIPPSYRVFLLNNNYFDIVYEEYSLMVKVEKEEYYLGNIDEKNYAIKHINRLLTGPIPQPEDEEDTEDTGDTGTPTPPSPPPAEEPAEEPEA